MIDGFNNWLQSFSKHSVTKDKNLQGEREFDVDQYTGYYEAWYDGFNGEEVIFGGTALERDNGYNLELTYTLTITSGDATLYWLRSGEEYIVCEETAEASYQFTLSSGDNDIVLRGDHFDGNLELTVEDVRE